MRIKVAVAGLLALILVDATRTALALTPDIQTIALGGEQAPGAPEGRNFAAFGGFFGTLNTSVNATGRTAFRSNRTAIVNGGFTNSFPGIWSDAEGDLDLLVERGQQATPGGGVFDSFSTNVLINDSGRVLFSGSLDAGVGGIDSNNNGGIWSLGPGGLREVMREGQPAPGGIPGVVFTGNTASVSDKFRYNNADQAAFYATVRNSDGSFDSDRNEGFWLSGPSGITAIAQEGVQAPGLPVGAVFDSFGTGDISGSLNDSGDLIFRASLAVDAGGVTSFNDSTMWMHSGGTTSLIGRENGPAPGAGVGARFDVFNFVIDPRINDSGHYLFNAFLKNGFGGVTAANDEALWSNRDGSLDLLYQSDSFAPGAPAGARISSFSFSYINSNSDIAFLATLKQNFGGVTSDDDRGLWFERDRQLELIAREGSAAVGAPGAVYDSVGSSVVLNDAGQIAFQGTLRVGVGGVTEDSDAAIWATDQAGVLRLIAREGDTIEVAPGDIRTITGLRMNGGSGGADGYRTPFADNGEIVFWADLDDADGVFRSMLVAAPAVSGDFNGDGRVDNADLSLLLGSWGDATAPAEWTNGFTSPVDNGELSALLGNWGFGTSVAIPEPSGLWLVLAVVGCLRSKR